MTFFIKIKIQAIYYSNIKKKAQQIKKYKLFKFNININ